MLSKLIYCESYCKPLLAVGCLPFGKSLICFNNLLNINSGFIYALFLTLAFEYFTLQKRISTDRISNYLAATKRGNFDCGKLSGDPKPATWRFAHKKNSPRSTEYPVLNNLAMNSGYGNDFIGSHKSDTYLKMKNMGFSVNMPK